MKTRILVILGIAVAVLALYTLFLRPEAGGEPEHSAGVAAVQNLSSAVATQAAGTAEAATEEAEEDAEPPATDADTETGLPGDAAAAERQPETWGSDPFVRDWVMTSELAEMSLRAITIGGDKAYALINDQILEVGDEISGKRVVAIESEKVVLEQGGRTFDLLLGE